MAANDWLAQDLADVLGWRSSGRPSSRRPRWARRCWRAWAAGCSPRSRKRRRCAARSSGSSRRWRRRRARRGWRGGRRRSPRYWRPERADSAGSAGLWEGLQCKARRRKLRVTKTAQGLIMKKIYVALAAAGCIAAMPLLAQRRRAARRHARRYAAHHKGRTQALRNDQLQWRRLGDRRRRARPCAPTGTSAPSRSHPGDRWQICARARYRDCVVLDRSLPDASAIGIVGADRLGAAGASRGPRIATQRGISRWIRPGRAADVRRGLERRICLRHVQAPDTVVRGRMHA